MSQMHPIDDLLSEYFRSEAPSPWPKAPHAAAAPSRLVDQPARRTLARSRLALALSLALVLIGGWWLTTRAIAPLGRPASLDGTTATRPAELRPGQ